MPKKEEQHFIKEKIKDKPLNKKKLLNKGIATIGYAILFGFVSCLVFCGMKTVIEPWFAPEPDPHFEIPKDSPMDNTAADDATMSDNESNVNQSETPKKESETKKQTVYITEKQTMTLDDFQVLQNQLYLIGNRVNKSVVTVTGIKEGTDIFDSPYEATGQASGLVIGNNGKELLILTEYQVIADVKSIRITFINNDTMEAKLKKYDGNTGIAVLSVPVKKIANTTQRNPS